MSATKRFKRDHTLLEQLPNELFIEIFGYLNGVDTIYAFLQLNNRFHCLIINYVNAFNFISVNKAKFDYVTKNHDVHQWRTLYLSEDEETPGQIRLFCQLFPPQQYLSQLQSLSALNMDPKYAQEFVSQIGSFNHLVSLTIGTICGKNIQPFELPSLKRFTVTACAHTDWMMNFRQLENLEYTIKSACFHDHVLTLPRTLKRLKLFYEEEKDGNAVRTSLRQLSQLTKLALYDNGNRGPIPDGVKWEELIQSSLPLLKTFQFCFSFHGYYLTLDHLKQAVASFSTSFYLLEKRWFIRCDSDTQYGAQGILYTLPFAFAEMPINITSIDNSMSTLIASDINDEAKLDSYENVATLIFNQTCPMPYRSFLTSNIVRLVLKCSFPTGWYSLLYNLRHLEFGGYFTMPSSDFSQLLAFTPQLQTLKLPTLVLKKLTDKFTNETVCDQLSLKIKSLTICRKYSTSDLDIVSVRVLSSLVRIFGKKCEHLSTGLIAHPNTVLPILRRMRQLRSLHIFCPHPIYRRNTNGATTWIEQSAIGANVSDYMYTDADSCHFFIWFGNRQ